MAFEEYPKHITVNGTMFEAKSAEHEAELRAGTTIEGEVPAVRGLDGEHEGEPESEEAESEAVDELSDGPETVAAGEDPNKTKKASAPKKAAASKGGKKK